VFASAFLGTDGLPHGRLYVRDDTKTGSLGQELIFSSATTVAIPYGERSFMNCLHTPKNYFVFVPDTNWNGIVRARIRAYDGALLSLLDRYVNLVVTPVNDAPKLVAVDANGKPLLESSLHQTTDGAVFLLTNISDVDVADPNPGSVDNGYVTITLSWGSENAVVAPVGDVKSLTRLSATPREVSYKGPYASMFGAFKSISYQQKSGSSRVKDTLTIKVNDIGNTGKGGPMQGSLTWTLLEPIVVVPPAKVDTLSYAIGGAFAGVFGIVAAYAAWAKARAARKVEIQDPFQGEKTGGQNPLFEEVPFSNNPLFNPDAPDEPVA